MSDVLSDGTVYGMKTAEFKNCADPDWMAHDERSHQGLHGLYSRL